MEETETIGMQATAPKLKQPRMYKVILLNDDLTPMDFVVEILEKWFNKNREQATNIMFEVHNQGRGTCGIYTKDVAETKVMLVNDYSRGHGYPLICVAEAVD